MLLCCYTQFAHQKEGYSGISMQLDPSMQLIPDAVTRIITVTGARHNPVWGLLHLASVWLAPPPSPGIMCSPVLECQGVTDDLSHIRDVICVGISDGGLGGPVRLTCI